MWQIVLAHSQNFLRLSSQNFWQRTSYDLYLQLDLHTGVLRIIKVCQVLNKSQQQIACAAQPEVAEVGQ